MNLKMLIFSLIALGTTLSTVEAGCPFGVCAVKNVVPVRRVVPVQTRKIVAYNVVKPVGVIHPTDLIYPSNQVSTGDRIVTGYKVNPTSVSLMIHLPNRHPSLFTAKQKTYSPIKYTANFASDTFNTEIRYGGDWVKLSVKNGKSVSIHCWDYQWRKHDISSVIPEYVRNLIGRIQIKMYGNTIEVIMPRF